MRKSSTESRSTELQEPAAGKQAKQYVSLHAQGHIQFTKSYDFQDSFRKFNVFDERCGNGEEIYRSETRIGRIKLICYISVSLFNTHLQKI
jgi:hypothetical protein